MVQWLHTQFLLSFGCPGSGQRHILYITGRTKRDAARSPYIEAQLYEMSCDESKDVMHHETPYMDLYGACVKTGCPTCVALDRRRHSCENKSQSIVITHMHLDYR